MLTSAPALLTLSTACCSCKCRARPCPAVCCGNRWASTAAINANWPCTEFAVGLCARCIYYQERARACDHVCQFTLEIIQSTSLWPVLIYFSHVASSRNSATLRVNGTGMWKNFPFINWLDLTLPLYCTLQEHKGLDLQGCKTHESS